jgi:large subunit ribosomal protein L23
MAIMKREKKNVGVGDYGVLLSPVITEKTATASGENTRVVFKVDPAATKSEVKAAVERVFKVKVDSVNTVNYQGKMKRTTGMMGRRRAFKKAYVVLAKGQTIQLVEGL